MYAALSNLIPGDLPKSQPSDRQQLTEEINLTPQSPSVLESLAGSWEGTLKREPQGTYEQRIEFE